MAGSPLKKQRVTDLQQANEDLQRQVNALKATSIDTQITDLTPVDLTDETRERLVKELLYKAEQGETLDEISSAWNITRETLSEWAQGDVSFGRALARARTRSRASISKQVRTSLANGRSVAGSMIDRLAKMYEDNADGGPGAERLVVVHKRARITAEPDA